MRQPLLLLCAILLLLTGTFSQAGAEGLRSESMVGKDGAEQYRFAEHLFNEGDYFRAISEYKRFLFHHPGAEQGVREGANFKIALAYFRAQQWDDAIEAFRNFLDHFPSSPRRGEALFFIGRAQDRLGLHGDALSTYGGLARSDFTELRNRALFESAMIHLELRQWNDAGAALAQISDQSALRQRAEIISEGLERVDELPKKSPATAGLLSAVLPGAGHLYTENYRDGLVAFLLNGLFIWAAVEQFDRGNYVTGGIVTFFELGWYTGSIYSALGSAHKYNERVEDGFIRSLRARTQISYMPEMTTGNHFLALSVQF